MKAAPQPPPASWATDPQSATRIWLIQLKKGGQLRLPQDPAGVLRTLYVFGPSGIEASAESSSSEALTVPTRRGQTLNATTATVLSSPSGDTELLMLQSRPIEEPVVQNGPFVMKSQAEIRQAISDYQQTQFGGWTWDRDDMVHGPKIERFALHPDGVRKTPKD